MTAPAPCNGLSDLFDSTSYDDHLQAARLCATCPRRAACADDTPTDAVGTWAGDLHGAPRTAIERLDAVYGDGEANDARRAYELDGDRGAWATEGRRVYYRRAARDRPTAV